MIEKILALTDEALKRIRIERTKLLKKAYGIEQIARPAKAAYDK